MRRGYMLSDFITSIICTIIFYKLINKTWRIDAIKEYTKEAISKGTYNEQYKSAYSHHLKGICNLMSIVFFVMMISNIFTNSIISMIIVSILALIISLIIGKYYPKRKENL